MSEQPSIFAASKSSFGIFASKYDFAIRKFHTLSARAKS